MICILPQQQREKDRIPRVYHAIAIAAIRWLIVLSERKEAVAVLSCRRRRLGRVVPEQLRSGVNTPVAVAV